MKPILFILLLVCVAAQARPRREGEERRHRAPQRDPDRLGPTEIEALLKGKQEKLYTWAPYDFLEKGLRTAPWVKDPFFPEGNGFKLSGVISTESAYINGRWYRRGDMVEGFLVREINPSGVTLVRRSEIVVLKLDQ